MIEYKVGQHLLIGELLQIAKIKSVRHQGNTTTLWMEHGKEEFSMSALKGSNQFVIKQGYGPDRKVIDTPVVKMTTIVNIFGVLILVLLPFIFF